MSLPIVITIGTNLTTITRMDHDNNGMAFRHEVVQPDNIFITNMRGEIVDICDVMDVYEAWKDAEPLEEEVFDAKAI